MPTSAQTPDPGLPAGLARDGPAPALADGQAKPHAKEQSRWADAVKPLPAVLNRLEKRALTVTILLFAFLALKAIVMSRGDIPAALGIFQVTNPAATVIGALLSALPLAAVAVLVIIGYRAAKEASSDGYALVVAAAFVSFFVTAWPILIASLIVAPAAGYAMRQRQRQRLMRSQGRRWRKQGMLLILLPCLAVFLYIAGATTWRVLYDVWLPHEATTLRSGRVEVGYVLSDDGNWVTILRSGQRRIVLYRDSQVGKRVPCQLRPGGLLANMTAWQALVPRAWTTSSEPDCPPGFRGSP
jgi:hypothetical protein